MSRPHARRAGARILALAFLVALTVPPGRAAAWGSIYGASTHQFVDREAYTFLSADPAYSGSGFPTLAQIEAHEGVNWTGTSEAWLDAMVGPGPDNEGSTDYSQHYYNPTTGEGKAPSSAAGQYGDLVDGLQTANADAAGKGAAWGAHFLADMYVPFHVVGGYRDTVVAEWNRQGGTGASTITLPAGLTGPVDLCYNCAIKDWWSADNYKTELGRYIDVATPVTTGASGNAHLDWFDAWYYNGTWPATVKSSSHIEWEATVSHDAGTVTTYDSRWKNPAPGFSNPGAAQEPLVEALAQAAASETRGDIATRMTSTQPALNHAVSSVATIWRASISALRPDIWVAPGSEAGTWTITAVVDNVAREAPTGVRVRLTVAGGSLEGEAERAIPGAVTHDQSITWTVKTDKPKECSLTLEVIGAYESTPDLQYARIAKPLAQPEGALDVIFCIDVTSSMSDDIDSVKVAAAGIVDKVAAKDPGYRVAVVAYRDWDDTEGYAMFEDYAFSSDRSEIVGNINSLSVGGGDDIPEAVLEALMRAINARSVGGWRSGVNKVVILMGDAPPHDPSRQGYTAAMVATAAENADPVVIQAVLVGNEGDFDPEAETAFADLATRTKGGLFRAEDSAKVVAALEQSIAVIPAGGPNLLPLAAGVGGVLALLAAVLLVLRSRRRARPALAQAGVAPAGGMPGGGQAWGMLVGPSGGAGTAVPGGTMTAPGQPHGRPWSSAVLAFDGGGGPGTGASFPLGVNQVLGSAPGCAIVLSGPNVAPQHAQVYAAGATFAIVDLGSPAGTWLNGTRVTGPAWLAPGDVITIGVYRCVFRN